ncbi:MAG: thiamine pyrophosphate-binding protein [Nostocoides sp.]
MSTASVIARAIGDCGVQRVFAYPGDPIIDFMDSLRQRDIDVVLARREGTAAFMAEATGMLTGIPGVCLSTLGPGSTALVNGVAAAQLDRVPMLAISGQIETARQAFFTHQVVDHPSLFSPVTKWAGTVSEKSVGTVMRKALRTAVAERPGAVHLTVAGDTFSSEATDADVVIPPMGPLTGGFAVTGADPAASLRQATRPILLVGTGAVRAEASQAVADFAQNLGIPVVVAPMAKGVIDETNPWFAGVLDMACNERVWALLGEADLIVAAGFDPVELIKPWSLPTPVLHIDSTPNTDQVYASDSEVVGDIGAALAHLAGERSGNQAWDAVEIRSFRESLKADYYSGRVKGALNPSDVVDTVREAAPSETVLCTDVGSHKILIGQGWTAYGPRSVLMTNGLSAMGFGVPAAIAAAIHRGDGSVIAMVGDGGFAMAATELRLAAALGLTLTVVVFVDGSLNRIELKQIRRGLPSTATRIEETDLVMLAESMGCHGTRVSTNEQLAAAMAEDHNGVPLVIEARIDPSQYLTQY